VWWPTRTFSSLTLSSSSLSTSPYCLSCSSACFACASTNPARSVWDAFYGDRWVVDASPWPWCSLSADMSLPTHKSLVWLLAAIIANVLPVVSGQFHVPLLSTYRELSSQVFISLDLNCGFPFLSILSTKNTDDRIRFCLKFQFRSTKCVLIFY
jgi:hypothetical protein